VRPTDSPPETDGIASPEPPGARSEERDAQLALAQRHANLGLPVGASERFRFAKRLAYRVSWLFLRHQVAFNWAIIEAIRGLTENVARLEQAIEQGIRDDLLDFADRSVSQAHAEITDQIADTRSTHAELILELRTLQTELDAVLKTVAVALPPDRGPAGLEGREDATHNDDSGPEGHR
jgi:hypothetical protein